MSFLVVYLTESLGYSLVAAGFALTVANLGGIVGRILWGRSPISTSRRAGFWG